MNSVMRTYIISICLLISGVSSLSAQEKVTIKGNIEKSNFNSIVLTDYVMGEELSSSAIDESGGFELSCKLDVTTLCKLGLDEQTFISLILAPGESITIAIDGTNLNEPLITGSKDSELLYSTIGRLNDYQKQIDDHTSRIMQERTSFLEEFLRENKSSLSVLFFLEQFDINQHPELYREVTTALSESHPGNAVVENYNSRFRDALFLPLGDEAPEIALPDTEGNISKLSALRGKYVLIDFWAAWCGPCRREAPNLVRVYNKYKDKGFEIYGVSLDRDKNSWLGAIESDNLDWVHVSDLKYWQSEVVGLYGFSGIPYTVLIDREGKIIAKGLRGEQLENKLTDIFKL